MAASEIKLKDRDGTNFEQLAALDTNNKLSPQLTLGLWNGGSPVPVDGTNNVPVTIITAPVIVTVSRKPAWISCDQLIRPNNATAYTAATGIAPATPVARTFPNVVLANGGGGRIERALCYTSQTTMTGAIRLHLYRSATAPPVNGDQVAFTITQPADYLGFFDFSGFRYGLAEGFPSSSGAMAFTANAATTSLFARVETITGFTPVANQTFDFSIIVDQV